MKQNMSMSLMYVECEDDCFKAEGTDKHELAEILRMHVETHHHMKLTKAEAEKSVKGC